MTEHVSSFLAVPTLCKDSVRLELLAPSHARGLLKHGKDESVFRYMPCSAFGSEQDVNAFIEQALGEYQAGQRNWYHLHFEKVVQLLFQ